LVPAVMHGTNPGDPMWLVEEKGLEQDGSNIFLRVVKMTNVLSATPTFTDNYVKIPDYTITPFPADTQGQITTTLDNRILSADWRNNQLVLSQNVGIPGDTDVHAQWYLLSTAGSAPSLLQQGAISPGAGVDTEMACVALGTDGSIGMTYLESSPTENMSMYVTGRSTADALGTMETPVLVKSGEMNYQGTRTGDFSGITLDPTAPGGNTFWAVNEYATTTTQITVPNWGTWIAQFKVPTPVFSWTGNGTTTHWSEGANWSGGVAPGPNADLLFGLGATKFTSTNDFPTGSKFKSITISASGYVISGNSIVLANGLDGSGATGANTFGLNVTLSAAETFQAGSGSTDLTVSGTISNGGFLLTVGGGNGFLDFTNVLSGTGGLTLADTGTTTLSGPGNTFTGATLVQSGILVLDKTSGNAIVGPLTSNGATVQLKANNQIATNVAVTVNSGGLLDLKSNSNTIGSLTLSASSVTTETGALTVLGKITDSGASSIRGNLVLLAPTRTFMVNSGGTLTVSAVVSGAGGLMATGPGTLLLTASNSYIGGTILNGALLALGNANALSSGVLTVQVGAVMASGAALSVVNPVKLGGTLVIGGSLALTFTGPVTLTASRTVTTTNTAPTTFAGVVGQSASGFILTKGGTGTLILSGSNTYSGGTTLLNGTLALGNAHALGSGTLTVQGGAVRANGSALSVANAVTLAGTLTVAGSLDLKFTGPITLTGNQTLMVANTGTTTFAGVLGETGGSRSLTKMGAGLLVLTNSNTFSGGFTLFGGTLAVGNNSAVGTGTLTLTSGTILASGTPIVLSNALTLAGNVTIGGSQNLTFNGVATLTGHRTLTVSNTGTTTFAGAIGQSASGLRLAKDGKGTLVLAGSNTYTGMTTVIAGTLLVTGSIAGPVMVTNGGTLGGSGSTGAVTVQSGGTLMPGSSASQTAVLSTGNLALVSGTNFTVALNGTSPGAGGYDQVSVTGTINLGGSTLNVSVGYAAAIGDSYTIIKNKGGSAVVGTFKNLAEGATFVQNGMTFKITYKGGAGNDVVLTRVA
jgi:autotransporter-associated beta strand protein